MGKQRETAGYRCRLLTDFLFLGGQDFSLIPFIFSIKYDAKSSAERIDGGLGSDLVRNRWYETAFSEIGKERSQDTYILGLLIVVKCLYEIHYYEFQVRPVSPVVSFFFRNIDLQVGMRRLLRFKAYITEDSCFS